MGSSVCDLEAFLRNVRAACEAAGCLYVEAPLAADHKSRTVVATSAEDFLLSIDLQRPFMVVVEAVYFDAMAAVRSALLVPPGRHLGQEATQILQQWQPNDGKRFRVVTAMMLPNEVRIASAISSWYDTFERMLSEACGRGVGFM